MCVPLRMHCSLPRDAKMKLWGRSKPSKEVRRTAGRNAWQGEAALSFASPTSLSSWTLSISVRGAVKFAWCFSEFTRLPQGVQNLDCLWHRATGFTTNIRWQVYPQGFMTQTGLCTNMNSQLVNSPKSRLDSSMLFLKGEVRFRKTAFLFSRN